MGFYLLVLLSALPYRNPGEFRHQTSFCATVFLVSCLLRPVYRSVLRRSLPWLSPGDSRFGPVRSVWRSRHLRIGAGEITRGPADLDRLSGKLAAVFSGLLSLVPVFQHEAAAAAWVKSFPDHARVRGLANSVQLINTQRARRQGDSNLWTPHFAFARAH